MKPQDRLPLTYHLTIVKDPEKGSKVLSVVGSVIQGDEILSRKVFASFEDPQEALDELNRRATACYYFQNPESWEVL